MSGLPRAPVRARTRVVSRPPKVSPTRRSIPVEFSCHVRCADALVVASAWAVGNLLIGASSGRTARRGAVGGDVVGASHRIAFPQSPRACATPRPHELGGGEVALPRAPRLVLDPDELAGRRRVLVASRGDERFAARAVQRERASARAQLAVARAPAASALVARDPRRVGNHHDSGTRRRRRRGRRRRTRVARAADVAPCPGIISQSRRSALSVAASVHSTYPSTSTVGLGSTTTVADVDPADPANGQRARTAERTAQVPPPSSPRDHPLHRATAREWRLTERRAVAGPKPEKGPKKFRPEKWSKKSWNIPRNQRLESWRGLLTFSRSVQSARLTNRARALKST